MTFVDDGSAAGVACEVAMSSSYMEHARLSCGTCRFPLECDVWLVVDASERPDLEVRVMAGTLRRVICPSCGAESEIDGPLLVYRPGCTPLLLFSPAVAAPPEAASVHRQRLVGMLRRALGDVCDDSLASDATTIGRGGLASAMFGELAWVVVQDHAERMLRARTALEAMPLLRTEGLSDASLTEAIRQNPVLLAREVDLLLAKRCADASLSPKERRDASRLRSLLRRCREAGLERALGWWRGGWREGSGAPSATLRARFEAVAELLRSASWPETRRCLEDHRDALLTPEIDDVLDALACHFAAKGEPAERMELDRLLLRGCIRQGLHLGLSAHERLEVSLARVAMRDADGAARIEACRGALEIMGPDAPTEPWASAHDSLSAALASDRHVHAIEAVEMAIDSCRRALEAYTQLTAPERYADLHLRLAELLFRRAGGVSGSDLEEAFGHAQIALVVERRVRAPRLRAGAHVCLGLVHLERAKANHHHADFALAHFDEALRVLGEGAPPQLRAVALLDRGLALATRAGAGDVEACIASCSQALDLLDPETSPLERARCHRLLAEAWSRFPAGQETEARILDHVREEVEMTRRTGDALEEITASCRLGDLLFAAGRWSEAEGAYAQGLTTLEQRRGAATTELARHADAAAVGDAYANRAYCLLRQGLRSGALLAADRGGARALLRAMALRDEDGRGLPEARRQAFLAAKQEVRALEARLGHFAWDRGPPDAALSAALERANVSLERVTSAIRAERPAFRREDLDLDELRSAIPRGGALVVTLATSAGSAAFVIPDGIREITDDHVVSLDRPGRGIRELLLGREGPGWMSSYATYLSTGNEEGWSRAIRDVTGALWEALIAPVHERLRALGIGVGSPVTLVARGGMQLLPIHAAWRWVNGERRTLVDDYAVRYVPSVAIVRRCAHRAEAARARPSSLLAIANPTADLPFADLEATMVASLFPEDAGVVVRDADDIWARFTGGVHGRSHVHLACHAQFNWEEPTRSGLALSDKRLFDMADIIDFLDLGAARLVTLSACETGVSDPFRLRHEAVGMTSAFLQAGAAGVISTLWRADDIAAAILMREFYDRHVRRGEGIAAALRGAQLHVRDATADELGLELVCERRVEASGGSDSEALEDLEWFRANRGARVFSDPLYWAPFHYVGAE